MTSRNGQGSRRTSGFTLVELMLVLTLLAIVISVAAPSLTGFFKSRYVDHEAHRFLALTRYAQSRAVADGMPMILWLDTEQRSYGLHAEPGYVEDDGLKKEYQMNESVTVIVTLPDIDTTTAGQGMSGKALTANQQQSATLMQFRFLPDGFIGDNCPVRFEFCEGNNRAGAIQVGLSRNRLYYEIQAHTL